MKLQNFRLLRLTGCALFILLLWPDLWGQYQLSPLEIDPAYLPDRMDRLSISTDGFYWIGGARGLFRFTGESIEEVILKDHQGHISKDKSIQSKMIEDDIGRLWFSAISSFFCYDPVSEKVSSHSIEANGLQLKADYQPFHFDHDEQELWLKAGDRLWAYQVHSGNHRPLSEPSNAVHYSVFPLGGQAYRICGSRWMFAAMELIEIRPGESPAEVKEVIPQEEVICTLQLSPDSILLGTRRGLKLLDFNKPVLRAEAFLSDKLEVDVSSLEKTEDGRILASFTGMGVALIDLPSGQITEFLADKEGKKASAPDQLVKDLNGHFLSTQLNDGILRIKRDTLHIFNPVPTIKAPIREMRLDEDGNKYLLLNDGMVWRQSQTGSWTNLLAGVPDHKLPKTGSLAMFRDSLIIVGSRHLWLITPGGREYFSFPEDFIDRLMEQTEKPPLVITRAGIQSINIQNGELDLLPIPSLRAVSPYFFSNFFPLDDQQFIVNRQPSALLHISTADETYAIKDTTKGIGEIYCTRQIQDGRIYAAGNEGLFLLHRSGHQQIPLKIGRIVNPSIQTMTEDDQGNLWLGTMNGLLTYRPSDSSLSYFGKRDGLLSEQFQNTPPITLPNGEIWMATDAGVVAFQPEKLLQQKHHRDPYIAKIWTNEEPLQSDTSSHYLKRLELNYLRNTLKFKVAAKGFGRSAASGIRYQMLGYEEKAAYTDFNTTIRYPNLPPGNYTLQLTAINQNGLPSGVRELAVIIRPPFTQTLTFKLLAGLGLILLVGSGYAILLSRERQRQRRIQEQQARLAAERDRIAGEVHDDLGGQLSSIMYLSEELLLTEASPGTERELSRINELSRNSLQNVRDIIFALDNRRSTVADLGEQLRGSGGEFFADHQVRFNYEEKLDAPDTVLSSRQKRNLTLIIKEAWHNTAKHAQATEVNVHYQQTNKVLTVVVSDNGKGFDEPISATATGGYGLDNMREKATSIGGELSIDSTPGRGTRLTLLVPVSRAD